MKSFIFTNGKNKVKTYKEISNKKQGCYLLNEVLRTIKTDKVEELKNEHYDTRFEEITE